MHKEGTPKCWRGTGGGTIKTSRYALHITQVTTKARKKKKKHFLLPSHSDGLRNQTGEGTNNNVIKHKLRVRSANYAYQTASVPYHFFFFLTTHISSTDYRGRRCFYSPNCVSSLYGSGVSVSCCCWVLLIRSGNLPLGIASASDK